jgi:hypothetical protein
MKKLMIMGLLLVQVSAMASDIHYRCTTDAEPGYTVIEASTLSKKGTVARFDANGKPANKPGKIVGLSISTVPGKFLAYQFFTKRLMDRKSWGLDLFAGFMIEEGSPLGIRGHLLLHDQNNMVVMIVAEESWDCAKGSGPI